MKEIILDCPQLIERATGGWLAISTRDCPLKIGVTGQTADHAKSEYVAAFERCVRDLRNVAAGGELC